MRKKHLRQKTHEEVRHSFPNMKKHRRKLSTNQSRSRPSERLAVIGFPFAVVGLHKCGALVRCLRCSNATAEQLETRPFTSPQTANGRTNYRIVCKKSTHLSPWLVAGGCHIDVRCIARKGEVPVFLFPNFYEHKSLPFLVRVQPVGSSSS